MGASASRVGGVVGLVGSILLVVALAACTAAVGGPPVRSDRQRLVEAYRDSDPRLSELIRDVKTSVEAETTPWLPGWRILDVTITAPPHPRRFYVALADNGRLERLTARPDAYATVLRDAGVQTGSAEQAVSVATVFLDATRDFQAYAYRVASVDEIAWRPQLSTDQARDRAGVERTFRSRITPPQGTTVGDGWAVTTWMVTGSDLVRHTTTLGRPSTLTDQAVVERTGLPVPQSR